MIRIRDVYTRAQQAKHEHNDDTILSQIYQSLVEEIIQLSPNPPELPINFEAARDLDDEYLGVSGGFWYPAYNYPIENTIIDGYFAGQHGLLTMQFKCCVCNGLCDCECHNTANFVDVGQVDAGQVDVGQVDVGQVNVDQVDVGQVDVGQVDADQVDADQVDADQVDVGQVDVGQVDADQVDADQVDADQVDVGQADADQNENHGNYIDVDYINAIEHIAIDIEHANEVIEHANIAENGDIEYYYDHNNFGYHDPGDFGYNGYNGHNDPDVNINNINEHAHADVDAYADAYADDRDIYYIIDNNGILENTTLWL